MVYDTSKTHSETSFALSSHNAMDAGQRRAYFLLKLVIFFYPRPDEEENDQLLAKASAWQADEDRRWALAFVEENPATAFERTRAWFTQQFEGQSQTEREAYFTTIWQGDDRLPHVTEMQGLALLRLAQDWGIQDCLLRLLGKRVV